MIPVLFLATLATGALATPQFAPNNTDLVLLQTSFRMEDREDRDRGVDIAATMDSRRRLGTLYTNLTAAMVTQNNLGGKGPDTGEANIVYENVGVGGTGDEQFSIDMVVTSTSTYIPHSPDKNGKRNGFGYINVKCGEEVNLTFQFINNRTRENVSFDKLYLTFLDLDLGSHGVKEYVEFGPGIEEYFLSPDTKLDQEDTWNGGYKWTANAFTGDGATNPESALTMTAAQKEQAVTLRFGDVNPIKLLFGATECGPSRPNAGRNMMFGFESNFLCSAKNKTDNFWDDGVCIHECNADNAEQCSGQCEDKCASDCRCNVLGPTPVPTPAPAPDPEPAPTAASASGDPHMANVRGEHFDLWRLGDVELLKVPRGATASEMNFSMHALVEDLGETVQRCLEAPYITSLAFRGKWFGDRPVFADMRDGNLVAFVGDQELQRQRHPLVVGRISESKNVSVHMPIEGHVTIRVGGATIDVVRDVRPVHFFLNMQARSLSELGDSIGGILGQDDHSDVAKKPDCNKNSDVFTRTNGAGPRGSSASASLDF